MDERLSRRDVLKHSAALGALAAVGGVACSKPKSLSCVDTTSLSAADAQTRVTLVYVDNSVEPGKTCSGCQQFIPAAPDACGTCKVVKGPINPKGNCKSFVAKPA
jgi:TAT (twin-arginine translocation) pathway signal sequence